MRLNGSEHSDLVLRAEKWLRRRCGVVLTEYYCYTAEIPDAIGFGSNKSILIECKTSPADYKADGKKPHRNQQRRLGNYRYYLVPAGMVMMEDVPEGWGLLYAHAKNITEELKAPCHIEPEIKVEECIMLYSLVRRAEIRGLLPELTKPLEKGKLSLGK